MRLSTRSRYAVRVLAELARRYGMGPALIADIAASHAISPRYLDNILRRIHKAGIVELRRGAGGGCWLVREPSSVSVWDVVSIVEDFKPAPCREHPDGSPRCPRYDDCAARDLWQGLEALVKRYLSAVSLADLARKSSERSLPSNQPLSFEI